MKLRFSLFNLFVLMTLATGVATWFWSSRELSRIEPRIKEMRRYTGEVTISNRSQIHAISKARYGNESNRADWELFLPNGGFQICFAKGSGLRKANIVYNEKLVHRFPLQAGKHSISIAWSSPDISDMPPDLSSPSYQRVDFFEDGMLLGSVENVLPTERITFRSGNEVPVQVSLDPTTGARLSLERFRQASPNGEVTGESPLWEVWIEPVK